MDEEIKNLIDEYVKQIESKETDLVFLKREIDKIIFHAQGEMKKASTDLDQKFDTNSLTEEEYLKLFREEKEKVLQKTKEKLDSLVQGIEEVSTKREESVKADEEKIKELRKKLDLPN
jgi:hypothetical protein